MREGRTGVLPSDLNIEKDLARDLGVCGLDTPNHGQHGDSDDNGGFHFDASRRVSFVFFRWDGDETARGRARVSRSGINKLRTCGVEDNDALARNWVVVASISDKP